MLTNRYLNSVKNVPAIFHKIITGTAPERFTQEHLKGIGFGASNDRAIIPLLKDLKFLTADGAPTQRYHNYRNTSISKKVLGEGVREIYGDLFHINANPTTADKEAIVGKFKSTHNVSDQVAGFMANTFFSLLGLSDIKDTSPITPTPKVEEKNTEENSNGFSQKPPAVDGVLSLRYNIEIHLPATKDIEVYNAIFKSLKQHLID